MPTAIPQRRRRMSGTDAVPPKSIKKSQSIEHLEDFLRSPESTITPGADDDRPEDFALESDASDSSSDSEDVNIIVENGSQRVTKPLPKKPKNESTMAQAPLTVPSRPIPLPANPSLVPVQARPPPSHSQSRRLIVVLEQACLESYRMSAGGGGKGKGKGKSGGEAKYTLLNCDDHQGILAKTGRDIADARPDITHQVRALSSQCRYTI